MQKQENSESVPDFNEGNVPKAPEPGTNLFSWDSIPDMGYGTEEKHWQVVRAAPSAGMSQDLQTKFSKQTSLQDSLWTREFPKYWIYSGYYSPSGLIVGRMGTGAFGDGEFTPEMAESIPKSCSKQQRL